MHKKAKRFHVHETRLRSFFKSGIGRVVEVMVDTGILLSIGESIETALPIAILIEILCWVVHFVLERVWAKIDYGRHVHEKGKDCKVCKHSS